MIHVPFVGYLDDQHQMFDFAVRGLLRDIPRGSRWSMTASFHTVSDPEARRVLRQYSWMDYFQHDGETISGKC